MKSALFYERSGNLNQFIENYLENIIPVPFEIETSEGISRLGEGVS